MSLVEDTSNANVDALNGAKPKYTFLEIFIVIIFISSQTVESSALNIILGLSIFYYIHTRLAITDKKIEELSKTVKRNEQ